MRYTKEQLLTIQQNSFKNYHVKGFDYICLNRSDAFTEKIYFLDGLVRDNDTVVVPHNHRYDFVTEVISGAIVDYRYIEVDARLAVTTYRKYNYGTPLNGGNGFTYTNRAVGLVETERNILTPNTAPLATYYDTIHTIKVLEKNTILRLLQLKDRLPIGEPTQTYSETALEDFDETGLYERFTLYELEQRLKQYEKARQR